MAVERLRRLLALCLLALCALGPATAAEPRIGVMTMHPGAVFWERFGHNAIVVDDGRQPLSYNFGFFDMAEPGFTGNFIRGRMDYLMLALPLEQDLAYYRQTGRGVDIQWLALSPAQNRRLRARLEFLARPENARYRYDYFRNNCATRVRDVLDEALDGQLQRQLSASSLGDSYRSESVRLAWPAKWMALGFDLGMNAEGDKALNRWDEAFIPMRLQDSLRGLRLADGRPLVREEQTVLPSRLPPPPAELPQWPLTAAAVGLALAGLLYAARRRSQALFNAGILAFWLVSGLIGSVLLAVWLGTEHRYLHANANLLLFPPLAWLAAALHPLRRRSPRLRAAYLLTVKAIAALAVAAVLLKFVQSGGQSNLNWILMALPAHWLITRQVLADNRTR